jgi:uncharacterized protein (DUF1330 family)
MMSVFILIDCLMVTDPETLNAHRASSGVTVERFGGRYVLSSTSRIETLEGNWKPNHVVVIEFGDREQAERWWHSPEHTQERAVLREAIVSNIILAEDQPC